MLRRTCLHTISNVSIIQQKPENCLNKSLSKDERIQWVDEIINIEATVSCIVATRNMALGMLVVKHEEQSAVWMLGAAQPDITVTEEYSICS